MTTLLRWLLGALLLASLIGGRAARAQQPPAATDSAPAHLVGPHIVRYRPRPRTLPQRGAVRAGRVCRQTDGVLFYIEASEVSIGTDEATVMVHVFRRPRAIHRPDYIGYTIALRRTSGGWGAPRLVSIAET
jgi:hypothetical protein